MRLKLHNLTVRREDRETLSNASLCIDTGDCVGLIGPNGAGKTTLFRAALGLLPAEGESSLTRLSVRERAKSASWLPQAREIAWPVPVRTLVSLGRTPYLAGGRRLSAIDCAAVDRALRLVGLEPLQDRPATELSAGEQARALLARAIAQDTPLLLADEPIAGLDPAHQIAAMTLFGRLAEEGKSVIVSLHDLTLAARYCTRLILLDHGRIVADGDPRHVLTESRVRDVFGVRGIWSATGFHATEAA